MGRLRDLLDMIKFEHTVFALPFALLSLFLASDGLPELHVFLWVLAAMVGARSSAMMMNRIADRHVDAENPRTAMRHLPRGTARLRDAWIFTLLAAAVFVLAAWRLNALAFRLSPLALTVIWSYSWAKRFTWASHLWLGIGLGLAPLGAWIAARGRLDTLPLLLGAGVVLWVAGFDTIYACQDVDFDRRRGLYSLPARFGTTGALRLARLFHVAMLGVFAAVGFAYGFGWLYALGLGLVALLVVAQHLLVSAGNLRHIQVAFFNVNSIVGVLLLAFAVADRFFLG
ncbi:MAG: UbiA-like polyprenyltransferase [Candidatus Krumholzibacteriia bacterium]